MTHHLTLYPRPFEDLKNSKVKVELRLNYEKYADLKVGDEIIFSHHDDPTRIIKSQITYLNTYPSFQALYEGTRSLFPEWEMQAFIDSMYVYYTPEQEARYGALEIGLRLLNNAS